LGRFTPNHVWTELFLRRIDQERPALDVPHLDPSISRHPFESKFRRVSSSMLGSLRSATLPAYRFKT
jgi:hypothetical protein